MPDTLMGDRSVKNKAWRTYTTVWVITFSINANGRQVRGYPITALYNSSSAKTRAGRLFLSSLVQTLNPEVVIMNDKNLYQNHS